MSDDAAFYQITAVQWKIWFRFELMVAAALQTQS